MVKIKLLGILRNYFGFEFVGLPSRKPGHSPKMRSSTTSNPCHCRKGLNGSTTKKQTFKQSKHCPLRRPAIIHVAATFLMADCATAEARRASSLHRPKPAARTNKPPPSPRRG